jgi:hypothetical protein
MDWKVIKRKESWPNLKQSLNNICFERMRKTMETLGEVSRSPVYSETSLGNRSAS